MLPHPIAPRAPGAGHIPGYEINHHFRVDINLPLDIAGGYTVALALDDNPPAHQHTITINVVVSDAPSP